MLTCRIPLCHYSLRAPGQYITFAYRVSTSDTAPNAGNPIAPSSFRPCRQRRPRRIKNPRGRRGPRRIHPPPSPSRPRRAEQPSLPPQRTPPSSFRPCRQRRSRRIKNPRGRRVRPTGSPFSPGWPPGSALRRERPSLPATAGVPLVTRSIAHQATEQYFPNFAASPRHQPSQAPPPPLADQHARRRVARPAPMGRYIVSAIARASTGMAFRASGRVFLLWPTSTSMEGVLRCWL